MKTSAASPFEGIVSCEHASNSIPAALGTLGLAEGVLETHTAYDPGAPEISKNLSERFSLPLLLGDHTRLVADLNRSPDNPDAVPAIAFGVPVPGNQGLDDAARAERIALYHAPYWDKIRRRVEFAIGKQQPFVHLSVHSFTPEYNGEERTLDVGLLYEPARPKEQALAEDLREFLVSQGLDARFNEPYDGRQDGLVSRFYREYGEAYYVGIEFEVNQRWVDNIDEVGDALAAAVEYGLQGFTPG